MFCDNLEGWNGREAQEKGDMCIPMADLWRVWQRLTQFFVKQLSSSK